MNTENIQGQQDKELLIEEFGQYIETEDKLPPLAARILAHLVIDNHKGITFEEMVELLKASKSSVFTNLNILLHKGRITYYTLPGDRKKYYTVSPDDTIDRMNERIKSCDHKLALCNKIIVYKKSTQDPGNGNYLLKQINYLESFIRFLEQYKALCLQHKEELIHLKK
ncbi:GbsR/MarR family transcriptional regulator [Anseongella ginsenosidimutans]|nr:hypothetical protein [Anseongella ginsenosidimutans]QEC51584.1 hypothetical protein FRZ59_03950 [Anseongella ginsenosidimutans]